MKSGTTALALLAFLLQAPAGAQQPPESKTMAKEPKAPAIDPKADETLKKMSEYLASLKTLSVATESSTQVVSKAGEKINFDAASTVAVERPNHLRSDRKSEVVDLSFYYDGKAFSIHGKGTNTYATAPAPPQLDAALDEARNRLGIEAPGADLLFSDPYKILKEDVVSGTYVGKAMIEGAPCHHLAFRGRETDWQIWIADGPQPVPRKYLVTSKKVKQAPEFVVELNDWNTSAKFPADFFTLKPPEGATKIAFAADVKSTGKMKR